MSLTSAQLLTVAELLADKCALATNVDYVLPSPLFFGMKADFWTALGVSAYDTQTETETNRIRAVWVYYLRQEDDDREDEYYVKTVIYGLSLFSEVNADRQNEADSFDKRVSKANHEHDVAVFSLFGNFHGQDQLVADETFPGIVDVGVIGLTQTDNTERGANCPFIAEPVSGAVTRMETAVRMRFC